MAIEIVDFPIKNVIFHGKMLVHQRVFIHIIQLDMFHNMGMDQYLFSYHFEWDEDP